MRFFLAILMFQLLAGSAHASALNEEYKGTLSFIYEGAEYAIVDLPKFEDFPVVEEKTDKIAEDIDWQSHKDAWTFRTTLRSGLKKGANFNSNYSITTNGCGTSCQMNWVVRVETGKVVGSFDSTYGSKYQIDSGLIIVNYPLFEGEDLSEYGSMLSDIVFYKVENDELIQIKDVNIHQEVEKAQKK